MSPPESVSALSFNQSSLMIELDANISAKTVKARPIWALAFRSIVTGKGVGFSEGSSSPMQGVDGIQLMNLHIISTLSVLFT